MKCDCAICKSMGEWTAKPSAEWVREKGSTRLRLALELGYLPRCGNLYWEERLQSDMPGWLFKFPNVQIQKIFDPSLKALECLRDAREAHRDLEVYLGQLPAMLSWRIEVLHTLYRGRVILYRIEEFKGEDE